MPRCSLSGCSVRLKGQEQLDTPHNAYLVATAAQRRMMLTSFLLRAGCSALPSICICIHPEFCEGQTEQVSCACVARPRDEQMCLHVCISIAWRI